MGGGGRVVRARDSRLHGGTGLLARSGRWHPQSPAPQHQNTAQPSSSCARGRSPPPQRSHQSAAAALISHLAEGRRHQRHLQHHHGPQSCLFFALFSPSSIFSAAIDAEYFNTPPLIGCSFFFSFGDPATPPSIYLFFSCLYSSHFLFYLFYFILFYFF